MVEHLLDDTSDLRAAFDADHHAILRLLKLGRLALDAARHDAQETRPPSEALVGLQVTALATAVSATRASSGLRPVYRSEFGEGFPDFGGRKAIEEALSTGLPAHPRHPVEVVDGVLLLRRL